MQIVARWTDWEGRSLEHLVLRIDASGVVADSVHVSAPEDGFAARYRIVCDGAWRTRRVEIELPGSSRRLILAGDGQGRWTDGEGRRQAGLDGAIDVDLAITPFTNTLPIRRLGGSAMHGVDLATSWVSFPDLAVHRDPQRYTCLELHRRWRYESRDSTFARELEVDDDGLVVTYPGLFRRVA